MNSLRAKIWKAACTVCVALGLFIAGAIEAKTVTFTILSFNDVYEIFPDKHGRGGFASMQTLLNEERAKSKHHITTVNGDFLSPAILSIFDKGAHRIELFNMLGVDMVALGNHEFDFGAEEVVKRISESKFPWLGANAYGVDGKPFTGQQQTFIVEADGVKIGFFGLITVETPELSSTNKKVCFAPLAFTARQMIADLKAQGADVIVALTHLLMAEDRQLAKEVPEIDVILGGHDHDPITWYDDRTFIHKSGQNANYLARIDLVIEKEEGSRSKVRVFPSWKLILNKDIPADPVVSETVEKYRAILEQITSEVLGKTDVEVNTLYTEVRTQESVMGNLVADAMRVACDADATIITGGLIRGNKIYPPGAEINMKDLFTEMPFGNLNIMVEITGKEIWQALENGVSQFDGKAGRFPQVSNIVFAFDPDEVVGKRIKYVLVNGKPLHFEKNYKIATVDYMFNGGDGYSMFKSGRILISPLKQMDTVTSVAEYIKVQGGIKNSLEGRIVRLDKDESLDDIMGLPEG